MPTALDNGQRSPRKLLRAVVVQLLGRRPSWAGGGSRKLEGGIVRRKKKLRVRLPTDEERHAAELEAKLTDRFERRFVALDTFIDQA